MKSINVCFACDKNYIKHTSVTAASILKNANADDNLSFYIIHDGLDKEDILKFYDLRKIKNFDCKFIEVKREDFSVYKDIKIFKYITLATLYRLKIPSLLNDIDKVIYLDSDIVVNVSLRELFETDIKKYYLAGVLDITPQFETYVNAGVLLLNLELIRKEGGEEKFIQYAVQNKYKIKQADQEIINVVLKDRVKIIKDKSYNVQSGIFTVRSFWIKKPKIIHFIGKYKPWEKISLSYYKNYYFKYLQLTSYKLNIFDYFIQRYIFEFLSYLKFMIKKPSFFLNLKFYRAFYKTYLKNDEITSDKDDIEIFILTYNRKEFLIDSIKSVINQTIKNVKLTVVDNGSDYNVYELIEKFKNKHNNIHLFRQNKNVKVEKNIKTAINLVNSKYALIMHDDDILHPCFIEIILKLINKEDDIDLICPNTVNFKSKKEINFKNYKKINYQILNKNNALCKNFINKFGSNFVFPSIVYKKENIKNVVFDEKMSLMGAISDNYIIAQSLCGGKCIYINNPLYFYREHKNQESKVLKLYKNEIISFLLFYKNKLSANFYTGLVFEVFSYYRIIQLYNHFKLHDGSLEELEFDAYKKGAINEMIYILLKNGNGFLKFFNYLLKKKLQKPKAKNRSFNLKKGAA